MLIINVASISRSLSIAQLKPYRLIFLLCLFILLSILQYIYHGMESFQTHQKIQTWIPLCRKSLCLFFRKIAQNYLQTLLIFLRTNHRRNASEINEMCQLFFFMFSRKWVSTHLRSNIVPSVSSSQQEQPLSVSQYRFRSSRTTADDVTVISDIISQTLEHRFSPGVADRTDSP